MLVFLFVVRVREGGGGGGGIEKKFAPLKSLIL